MMRTASSSASSSPSLNPVLTPTSSAASPTITPKLKKMKEINLLRGWPSPALLPIEALRLASQSLFSNPNAATPALCYGPDAGYQPLRESIAEWVATYYDSSSSLSSDSSPSSSPPSRGESSGQQNEGGQADEKIAITGGASQNLACVLQVYTDPKYTRKVWMVAPTYYLACRIFADAGLEMRAVCESKLDEADLGWLEKEMVRVEQEEGMSDETYKPTHPYSKFYRHVIYLVPSFSNPTGKTLSIPQRTALVRLARRRNALIVTDDVYDFLYWPSSSSSSSSSSSISLPTTKTDSGSNFKPPPRLIDIDAVLPFSHGEGNGIGDGFSNTLSNASFSKLLGPGARTGWAASSSRKLIYGLSQCGSSRSGGAPSQAMAAIIGELFRMRDQDGEEKASDRQEGGKEGAQERKRKKIGGAVEKHVSWLRTQYSRRYHIMLSAVEEYLVPLGVTIEDGRMSSTSCPPSSSFSSSSTPPAAPEDQLKGGYFIWLRLPSPVKAKELVELAKENENLIVSAGEAFEVWGDEQGASFADCIRLCWAWEGESDLREGVRRLGSVLRGLVD